MHDLSVFYAYDEFTGTASTNQFRYETEQVCVFCHTPHSANQDFWTNSYWDGSNFVNGAGPKGQFMLWNRDMVSAGTLGYYLYTSSTMKQTGLTEVWPYSLVCLSCHDGVSALNVLHNNPNDVPAGPIEGDFDQNPSTENQLGAITNNPANIGGRRPSGDTGFVDLANDHPISINYATSRLNGAALRIEDAVEGYVGDSKVRLFPNPDDVAAAPVSVECATCHDVHNEGCPDSSCGTYSYRYPFLSVTNQGSFLCTRCHLK